MAEPALGDRFPALRRLGAIGRARKVPYVQQMTATECGAACLAMVLGYHGKLLRIEEVRAVTGIGRDGVNALSILNAAQLFGLRGRGVKLEVEDLEFLDEPAILHWEFKHFVVFERLRGGFVDIIDPAFGRRRVAMVDFRRSFTGVALLLEPSDDFEPTESQRKGVWRYIRAFVGHSFEWRRIVVTSLLLQLFALALPLMTGAVVDRVVPRADGNLLAVLGAGLLSMVGFHFLASMVRAHLLLRLRTHLDSRMTLGFLDHLASLPYSFFQQRPAGDLMMRMNSNSTIRELLTSGALSSVLDGGLVILYLAILFLANSGMALLALIFATIQMSLFFVTRDKQRDLLAKNLAIQAKAESFQIEMLSGIETLKSMGSERRAVEHWSDLFVDVLNVSIERGRLSAAVDSLSSSLRLGAPLVILLWGTLQVMDGHLTLGAMLGLNAVAIGFLTPLSSLVSTAMQLQLLGSYIDRIDDVMTAAPEQERGTTRQPPRLMGNVKLDHVSFRYDAQAPEVVRDVTLEIGAGKFVAVVGKSGSGKSTLASLLAGLYPPTQGMISYDDMDLRQLDLGSVRRQLGIVTQRPYLFGTSIRANIALANPSLELSEIMVAARLARIHDDIAAMPLGYETLLMDGGTSLSGGQRQRVALARALVRKPAILLLDEATSALDTLTEIEVQRELKTLGCTRIVIAHRLSTIIDADEILVMDAGRVVERGRHAELLVKGGLYTQLVMAQEATPSIQRLSVPSQ